jgi:hypothetical protein
VLKNNFVNKEGIPLLRINYTDFSNIEKILESEVLDKLL